MSEAWEVELFGGPLDGAKYQIVGTLPKTLRIEQNVSTRDKLTDIKARGSKTVTIYQRGEADQRFQYVEQLITKK